MDIFEPFKTRLPGAEIIKQFNKKPHSLKFYGFFKHSMPKKEIAIKYTHIWEWSCDHSNHSYRHDRTHLIKVLNNTRTVIKTSLSTSFPCTCVYINKNNEITTTTTKKEIRTYNRTEHREEVQSEVRRPMCPLNYSSYTGGSKSCAPPPPQQNLDDSASKYIQLEIICQIWRR